MASSNEGDPPGQQLKIIPKGPDDFIGIGAWLWRCDNPNPVSDPPPTFPVLYAYMAELALRTKKGTDQFMALFFHCYMTHVSGASYLQDRKHDRPTITRRRVELNEEEGGGRIDVQCEDDDVSIPFLFEYNLADEGKRLFKWLQDRHPDLAARIHSRIGSEHRESLQRSEDPEGEGTKGISLDLDRGALRAYWGGKPLGINQHADFTILDTLYRAFGTIVYYADLWRALKPRLVNVNTVQLKEVPEEVKQAASRIKKALKAVGASLTIKNVKNKGYMMKNCDG